MAINRVREKVRDGYLGDLPENIRVKVMNIHKLIKDTVDNLIEEDNYSDLRESRWAMSCLDDFKIMPKDKSEVGSIRVYKNGRNYKCMIQATGHFRNHEYGWVEELLHDFIGNVYSIVRPIVRRKYDMTITNEGKGGEPYEGFDIYPTPKEAKMLWENMEDRKTKSITEYGEIDDDFLDDYEKYFSEYMDLDEFLFEAQSRKLIQVAHRLSVVKGGPRDGHKVHVIYDLRGPWVIDQNNVVWDGGGRSHRDPDKGPKGEEGKRLIRKYGNTDFMSHGHVVKAVRDLDANNELVREEIQCVGPFNKDNYGAPPATIQMGKVCNSPEFKSTYWDNSGRFNSTDYISNREGHNARGHALNLLNYVEDRGDNTPIKRKAYLRAMKKDILDLRKKLKELGREDSELTDTLYTVKSALRREEEELRSKYGSGLDLSYDSDKREEDNRIRDLIDKEIRFIAKMDFEWDEKFHNFLNLKYWYKRSGTKEPPPSSIYGGYDFKTKSGIRMAMSAVESRRDMLSPFVSGEKVRKDVNELYDDYAHLVKYKGGKVKKGLFDESVEFEESMSLIDMVVGDLFTDYYESYSDFMDIDVYLERVSRRKLQVAHRLAHDRITGHDIHIIYAFNDITAITRTGVEGGGHGHKTKAGLYGVKVSPDPKVQREMIEDIRKNGNTDFESINQKVLAIIDLETGEHLQTADTFSAFGWSGYDHIIINVGQIDYSPSFKSTYWDKDKDKNNFWDISAREGHRMRGVRGQRYQDTGYFSKKEIMDAIAKGEADEDDLKDFINWRPGTKRRREQDERIRKRNEALASKSNGNAHPWDDDDDEPLPWESVKFSEAADNSIVLDCGIKKLPKGLAHLVTMLNKDIHDNTAALTRYKEFDALMMPEVLKVATDLIDGKGYDGEIGRCIITKEPNGNYTGEIQVTPMPEKPIYSGEEMKALNRLFRAIQKKLSVGVEESNPGKHLVLTGPKDRKYFILALESEYAGRLYEAIKKHKTKQFKESSETATQHVGDVTPAEAKKTMRAVTQQLINDFKSNKSKKMTQYTANIYANLITKNLLPEWAGSFRKFSITLEDYQSFHTVEFKIPKMTQDFIGRYVQGRESLEGFLHRRPEIKMKMSPRVFHSMKNPDDAYNFFKAAISYYDKNVSKAAQKLMAEVMRLPQSMKHLIGTSKLSGLVTYPMALLFVFDDVDMSNRKTFQLSNEDIRAVSSFVKNISSHYAAPEKEKKKIIEDVQNLVRTLRESCSMDDNLRELYYLPEEVNKFLTGKYDNIMADYISEWQDSQVDYQAMREAHPQVKYISEKFGVKKLKKIPSNIIAYIQIEAEAIRDANDKMMIASYCISKIDIVEWYIELIDVGSKKYVVPHTKPWLELMRTQLLACYKKIMATPVPKADRPIIDIKYPNGYEG